MQKRKQLVAKITLGTCLPFWGIGLKKYPPRATNCFKAVPGSGIVAPLRTTKTPKVAVKIAEAIYAYQLPSGLFKLPSGPMGLLPQRSLLPLWGNSPFGQF
jgi:hypothetical protein